MGAKVHKSLRIESDLIERVEKQREQDEPLSNAICRVLLVGCETLEGVTREDKAAHAVAQERAQAEYDEKNEKIITLLENENARLITEHENDLRRIEEKDKQLAAALEKAHELADQSHVLIGMSQETKRLPDNDKAGEVLDITPSDRPMTFGEWFRQRFGN